LVTPTTRVHPRRGQIAFRHKKRWHSAS